MLSILGITCGILQYPLRTAQNFIHLLVSTHGDTNITINSRLHYNILPEFHLLLAWQYILKQKCLEVKQIKSWCVISLHQSQDSQMPCKCGHGVRITFAGIFVHVCIVSDGCTCSLRKRTDAVRIKDAFIAFRSATISLMRLHSRHGLLQDYAILMLYVPPAGCYIYESTEYRFDYRNQHTPHDM